MRWAVLVAAHRDSGAEAARAAAVPVAAEKDSRASGVAWMDDRFTARQARAKDDTSRLEPAGS